MFFSGIWHFVYRHLVVGQTGLTVCNCVVGTDILSTFSGGHPRRAGSTLDGLYFSVIQLKPPRFTLSVLLHLATACTVHTLPLISFFLSTPSSTSTLWLGTSGTDLHAPVQVAGADSSATLQADLMASASKRMIFRQKGGLSGYYGDGGNVNATGSSRTRSHGVRLPVITPGLRAHFKPYMRTLIHPSSPLLWQTRARHHTHASITTTSATTEIFIWVNIARLIKTAVEIEGFWPFISNKPPSLHTDAIGIWNYIFLFKMHARLHA